MINVYQLDPEDQSDDALVGFTMTRKEAEILALAVAYGIDWEESSPIVHQVLNAVQQLCMFELNQNYQYRCNLRVDGYTLTPSYPNMTEEENVPRPVNVGYYKLVRWKKGVLR